MSAVPILAFLLHFTEQNGRYGNPWKVGDDGTLEEVVAKYETFIRSDTPKARALRDQIRTNLRGLTLVMLK